MTLSDLLNNTTTKRDTLKLAFNVGQVPTQQNFHEMIDGLFQIQGTTLYKDDNSGLGIQAGIDITKPVLNFYDDPAQAPVWSIGIQNGLEIKDATSVTRLTVANDGNVGVGTTSPTSTLEVYATSGNTATGMVISQGNDGGNTNSGRLFFHNASDPGNAFTIVKTLNRLSFMSNANPGTTSGTERISLTNQGNVGIGINVPQSKLEIQQNQVYTTAHEANALVVRTPTAPSPNDGRMVGISLTIGESADVHDVNQKSASIFAQSTNQYANIVDLLFYTRGSSSPYYSEKMRVTGNGNIGVGTTNPLGKLDILLGGFANASALSFKEEESNPTIKLYRPTGSFISDIATTYPWWIENSYTGLNFKSGGHAVRGTETVSTKVFFQHDGNVGIGTTTPGNYKLNVAGVANIDSLDVGEPRPSGSMPEGITINPVGDQNLMQLIHDHWGASQGLLFNCYKNNVGGNLAETNNLNYAYDAGPYSTGAGAIVFVGNGTMMHFMLSGVSTGQDNPINWGGATLTLTKEGRGFFKDTVTAKGQLLSSDARLKQDIESLTPDAISKLQLLRGTSFQWLNDNNDASNHAHIGLVAQELQEVFPELVSEDDQGYLAINYTGLIPIIVEANKQQERRIEVLEAKLAKFMNQ